MSFLYNAMQRAHHLLVCACLLLLCAWSARAFLRLESELRATSDTSTQAASNRICMVLGPSDVNAPPQFDTNIVSPETGKF